MISPRVEHNGAGAATRLLPPSNTVIDGTAMADVAPKKPLTPPQKIAHIVRQLGAAELGVRQNAWRMLVREMRAKANFSDLGNWVERGSADNLYTEAQMLELAQAVRAEAVEQGIKIGLARASSGRSNGKSNGHGYALPPAEKMAEFCYQRPNQLKDDAQRKFIDEMYVTTQRGRIRLQPGTLGYLASIYIKLSGRT